MIKLPDGTWRYSPEMPIKYTQGGKGPGEWVGDDTPKWNITYLSELQNLELLRTGELSLKEFYKQVPPQLIGKVQAFSHPMADCAVPGLRDTLTQPISLFIHLFRNQEIRTVEFAALYGGKWYDRILENAQIIWDSRCDKEDEVAESMMIETVGNVIKGNFGKK